VNRGLVPLPKGLTTHKLRHTFASILIACGEDPISLMRQIGHTDPTFTLRVYTHLMSRNPDERTRLKALVRGERVIAREAPEPPLLALEVYEQPILQALAEGGGRASRSEIIAALAEALADRHSARDLEPLPSGPPRWQPRVGKVRARLVQRGWLQTDKGRDCAWELTECGWKETRGERELVRKKRSLRRLGLMWQDPPLEGVGPALRLPLAQVCCFLGLPFSLTTMGGHIGSVLPCPLRILQSKGRGGSSCSLASVFLLRLA
jgi:Mrr N-terminal domain/Phage integrase family